MVGGKQRVQGRYFQNADEGFQPNIGGIHTVSGMIETFSKKIQLLEKSPIFHNLAPSPPVSTKT